MSHDQDFALRLRTLILAALAGGSIGCQYYEDEVCLSVPSSGKCLSAAQAKDSIVGQGCGEVTVKVLGEAELKTPPWFGGSESGSEGEFEELACCYPVKQREVRVPACVEGRPLMLDARMVTPAIARAPMPADADGQSGPNLEGLDTQSRAQLAQSWLSMAQAEHASVAAFARLSLELMRFGAPADLLADCHAAALDEVRHAQLAFAMASAYAGERLTAGDLELPDALPLARSVAEIAISAASEGCRNETMAARQALEAARCARDPAVVACLGEISSDEARHAGFSWRLLEWALRRAPEAAVHVARILDDTSDSEPAGAETLSANEFGLDGDLRDHGVLSLADRTLLARDSRARVVAPCWRELQLALG